MPAKSQDVEMWQGDTRTIVIDVRNADGSTPDLTTATQIRWWMGRNALSAGADVFIEKELGAGIALTQTPGQIAIALAEADTLGVPPNAPRGFYYHEAEVRMPGVVSTVTTGKFTLNPAMIPGP